MMIRRLTIASAVLLTILLCPALEGRTAEAQGLFRRLRNRIQSRNQVQPYQPQVRPRYVPPQRSPSGLRPTEPQRSAPVTPRTMGVDPNRAPAVTPAPPVGGQSSRKAPVESKQFGGSILDQPSARQEAGDSEAPAAQPQATNAGARQSPAPRVSLGIQVRAKSGPVPGLEVAGFREGSFAEEAGLRAGDLIVAVDGRATPTVAEIAKLLEGKQGGDSVRVRVVRGRSTAAIMIPLLGPGLAAADRLPAASKQAVLPQTPIDLGIRVGDAEGMRGVIVSDVAADSLAATAGIQVGDRIVSVDGRLMSDLRTFNHELSRRKIGDELTMQMVRDSKLVAAEMTLADPASLANAKQPASGESGDLPGGSVLEGVGSMLGGLLGGKSKSKSTPKGSKDEMALGDDEPVDQVVFESEIKRALEKVKRDPPSLETLELPPGEAVPIDPPGNAKRKPTKGKQTAEQLREEIRRLEQRLKELESKQ